MTQQSAPAHGDAPRGLLPALFISHGSPLLAVQHSSTTRALSRVGNNLPKPAAVVIMSAHWLSSELLVNTAAWPSQWHDYQIRSNDTHIQQLKNQLGTLTYRPKGAPELAHALLDQLHDHGLSAYPDELRPLDHGVWAPLNHLYPQADVPVVQISLPSHYQAESAHRLGQALSSLREKNVLIVGSGSITHNLALTSQSRPDPNQVQDAKDFAYWLINQLSIDPELAFEWASDPRAHLAHPTPEHLMPLFFAAGVAPRVNTVHSSHRMAGLGMDIYRFD